MKNLLLTPTEIFKLLKLKRRETEGKTNTKRIETNKNLRIHKESMMGKNTIILTYTDGRRNKTIIQYCETFCRRGAYFREERILYFILNDIREKDRINSSLAFPVGPLYSPPAYSTFFVSLLFFFDLIFVSCSRYACTHTHNTHTLIPYFNRYWRVYV